MKTSHESLGHHRQGTALGTPRSATLKKYDMYKRMTQESSNNLDFGDGDSHGISGFGLDNGTPDHGA